MGIATEAFRSAVKSDSIALEGEYSDFRSRLNGTRAPNKEAPKLKVYNLAKLLEKPAPARKWVIEGLIPDEEVSSLGGDGGQGKSTIMLQIGCACASGRDWMGFSLKRRCKVLYLSCEDDQDEVHFRTEQIDKAEAVPFSLENFDAIEVEEDTILAAPDRATGRIAPTQLFLWLEEYITENSITLLMLDSVTDVFGGDELSRSHVRSFLQLLRARIARKLKCPVLFLFHPSVSGMKDGRGYSGVTHWNNGVRSRLYLETVKDADGKEVDPDYRMLTLKKTNRARAGLKIGLRWKDGCFVRDDSGLGSSGITIEQGIEDEALFLKLLDKLEAEGRDVHYTTGKAYAPKMLAEHPVAKKKKVTPARFRQAMENLFSVGKIKNVEYGPPSKKRNRLVRVLGYESDDIHSEEVF